MLVEKVTVMIVDYKLYSCPQCTTETLRCTCGKTHFHNKTILYDKSGFAHYHLQVSS